MTYYPFRKFKINDKKIYPILNNKILYPQHCNETDIDFLNQCFENVSFKLTYAIFQNSQYAIPAFCFYIEGQEILIKYENILEKFDKLTIDKGIIKNKMIFVSCGLKISVVFDYEEDFSFYHTELLSQGNSIDLFKTKEKDLQVGMTCSILGFEGSRLIYMGKKYVRKIHISSSTKIFVTTFVKQFHIFKFIDRLDRESYLFRKDLKNIHIHKWAGIQPVEEITPRNKLISDELNEREISPADIAYFYEIGLLSKNGFYDLNFDEIEFNQNTFSYFKTDNVSSETDYKY